MIDFLYIDNYKCFSNFQFESSSLELFLGDNGTGKSSLFDVIRKLKAVVVEGASTLHVFPREELCAWDSRPEQKFEIGFQGSQGNYRYRLHLEHAKNIGKNRIILEELSIDGVTLYRFDGRDAHLYRDDGSDGPVFPFDWNKSALATVPERGDNQKLSDFRERFSHAFVFSPDPLAMVANSQSESEIPEYDLRNLSSWLRHVFQDDIEAMQRIRDSLKDVLFGLQTLKHQKTGETSRSLQFQFDFSATGEGFWLPLDALSTGQRQLVALYSIGYALLKSNRTVCIDEPENFIALREIQPWLTSVKDSVEDHGGQLWIISHNPELLDNLAPEHGTQFYHDEGGPVRTKRFEWIEEDILRPSQIIARGWE